MRKKLWTIGIFLCVVGIAAFILWRITWPQPILPEVSPVSAFVNRVIYQGEDITTQMDPEALMQLLQETKCQYRWWKGYPDTLQPFGTDARDRWVIELSLPGEGYTIVLGQYNFRRSHDRYAACYEVLNPEQLSSQLQSLIVQE